MSGREGGRDSQETQAFQKPQLNKAEIWGRGRRRRTWEPGTGSLQDVSVRKAAAGMCCVGNEPRLQNVVLRAELQ